MDLSTPVEKIYMIGPIYARRLKKLGIETAEDLLHHFPFRYQDYSLISKIAQLQPQETVTIQGVVEEIKNNYTKNRKKIQKAIVSDETGSIEITWFNQPFLVKTIKLGEKYSFSGKADLFGKKIGMVAPDYELLSESSIHTGRLVPIYPETSRISSRWIRSRIWAILKQCDKELLEYLPCSILTENQFVNYKISIQQIHFPKNKELLEKTRQRLAFDELFLIQLTSALQKKEWEKEIVGNKFQISKFRPKLIQFIKLLPFVLTGAQKRAVSEILADLAKEKPMNRLLEGDVGSGKTVVAAIATYAAFLNGFQSVFMAPTEILANQHYDTIYNLLSPLGLKIGVITGNKKPKDPDLQLDITIGTHALLSQKLNFSKLGLVIIDEQHRFGVEQRAILRQKGVNPHLLTMTATPIPRTVALTLYGELDLSFLDEMPKGRLKIKTWVVPLQKRQAAYQWIKSQAKQNSSQAFIICPLIEESETLTAVRAATKEYENLKNQVFPDLKLGLLHGRLKPKEKDEVLKNFRQQKIDILVSTPVVEVGIDIPNAHIMMIEGADRFGLAQLHQLRGRVGRGNVQSYCLLFTESTNPRVAHRLKSLETINIGSQLAELDLKMRGPGEIYGFSQHGFLNLKIASLSDHHLIQKTKKAVEEIISGNPTLSKSPLLRQRLKKLKIKQVTPD